MATNNIQVVLELGHTAFYRPSSATRLTHEWVVFLRAAGDTKDSLLTSFVSRVVFHLHHTFEDPRRIVVKPPFEVRENGYAGFMMPIDVYFRFKGDEMVTRIRYDYNLEIYPEESRNDIRTEKFTFRNPSPDFRRRLLEGGGSGVLESDLEVITPGRRLIQIFEHRSTSDHSPKPLIRPLPFEDFARTFGLKLSSSSSSNSTLTQKVDLPRLTHGDKNGGDSRVSIKSRPVSSLPDKSRSSTNLDLPTVDKARGSASSANNHTLSTMKSSVSASQLSRSDKPEDLSRRKDKPSERRSPKRTSPRRDMGPASAFFTVSPRSGFEESPETILKKMGKSRPTRRMMSPLSPRSPRRRLPQNSSEEDNNDDVFLGKTLSRRDSTGFSMQTTEDKSSSSSGKWCNGEQTETSSGASSEPGDISDAVSSRKRKKASNGISKSGDNKPASSEMTELAQLYALLNNVTDRTQIQGVVDVLGPLGAFEIDRSAGTFSFNLRLLSKNTVEQMKKILRFDDFDFEAI